MDAFKGYIWNDAQHTCAHAYLLPILTDILRTLPLANDRKKLFDLGCGNGSTAAALTRMGWTVTGVDPSENGIAQARNAFPDLNLNCGSGYEPLINQFGNFPVLISLEVVEHIYDPRSFSKNAYDLIEPGGTVIISTPYHGYMKNLLIGLLGKWDKHFTALWDGGHIKFWSPKTLKILLEETGFKDIKFYGAGRIKFFSKSMIAVAKRPTIT